MFVASYRCGRGLLILVQLGQTLGTVVFGLADAPHAAAAQQEPHAITMRMCGQTAAQEWALLWGYNGGLMVAHRQINSLVRGGRLVMSLIRKQAALAVVARVPRSGPVVCTDSTASPNHGSAAAECVFGKQESGSGTFLRASLLVRMPAGVVEHPPDHAANRVRQKGARPWPAKHVRGRPVPPGADSTAP